MAVEGASLGVSSCDEGRPRVQKGLFRSDAISYTGSDLRLCESQGNPESTLGHASDRGCRLSDTEIIKSADAL